MRKSISDVHADLNRLRNLIDDANRSRQAVMAARGMFHSGAMEKWKHEVNADKAKIGELFKIAPNAQSTYDTLEAGQLESELVAVHRLRGEIKGLLDKYSEVICSDDERPMSLAVRHKCRRPL